MFCFANLTKTGKMFLPEATSDGLAQQKLRHVVTPKFFIQLKYWLFCAHVWQHLVQVLQAFLRGSVKVQSINWYCLSYKLDFTKTFTEVCDRGTPPVYCSLLPALYFIPSWNLSTMPHLEVLNWSEILVWNQSVKLLACPGNSQDGGFAARNTVVWHIC